MTTPVKTFSWEEIIDILSDQKHNHVSLHNLDGSRIIPYNKAGDSVANKLEEIKTTLNNPTLQDGMYYVRCKNTLNKSGSKFDYPIIVGTLPEAPKTVKGKTVATLSEPANGFEPNVTSYENVLELRIELERVKMENMHLREQVQNLESDLEDYEDAEEEEGEVLSDNSGMMGNIKSMLESTISSLTPMMDKHYELKERKLALEEKKGHYAQPNAPRQIEKEQQFQKDAIDYTDKKIQEFIARYESAPELHETFAKFYNDAQTMDEFFAAMKEYCSAEQFEELIQFINAKNGE